MKKRLQEGRTYQQLYIVSFASDIGRLLRLHPNNHSRRLIYTSRCARYVEYLQLQQDGLKLHKIKQMDNLEGGRRRDLVLIATPIRLVKYSYMYTIHLELLLHH